MVKAANLLLMAVLLLAIIVSGCDKDSGSSDNPTPDKTPAGDTKVDASPKKFPALGVDVSKPVAEIKDYIQKLNADQIKDTAAKYKEAIISKQDELGKLKDKIKEIPLTEMVTTEYKNLKSEIDELTKSTGALKERLDVYIAKLKEMGIDISEFKLN